MRKIRTCTGELAIHNLKDEDDAYARRLRNDHQSLQRHVSRNTAAAQLTQGSITLQLAPQPAVRDLILLYPLTRLAGCIDHASNSNWLAARQRPRTKRTRPPTTAAPTLA